MRKTFLKWWEGELEPYRHDPDFVIIGPGRYKRHWTAMFARWAVEFYLRESKWTLGAAAAVIGALVMKR
jgi:hypothetical protein